MLNKVFGEDTCSQKLYKFVAVICFIESHDFYLFLAAVYFWLGWFNILGIALKGFPLSIRGFTYRYLTELGCLFIIFAISLRLSGMNAHGSKTMLFIF